MSDNEEMKGNRWYISGPMRGYDGYNRYQFNRWTGILKDYGYDPINPFTIGDTYGTPRDIDNSPELLDKVLDDELSVLSGCDAIFLLDGWEKSEGAQKELECALNNGLKVVQQSTWEKESYGVNALAKRLEHFSNRYGVRIALGELVDCCMTWHPTTMQSFAGGFVIPYVRAMAAMKRKDSCDERNAAACEACDVMAKALEAHYDIPVDGDIFFPMI